MSKVLNELVEWFPSLNDSEKLQVNQSLPTWLRLKMADDLRAALPAVEAERKELVEALRLAGIRLGICADRMRACNESPQKHDLVGEVADWTREALARAKGE